MHFGAEGSFPVPGAVESPVGAAAVGPRSPLGSAAPPLSQADSGCRKVGKLTFSSVGWILLWDMDVKHSPEV